MTSCLHAQQVTFHPRKLPHRHHINYVQCVQRHVIDAMGSSLPCLCHVISMLSMPCPGITTLCLYHAFDVIDLPHVCHINARSPMLGHQFATLVPHRCYMLANNSNYPKMCRCAHLTPTQPKISTPQIPISLKVRWFIVILFLS